MYVQPRTPQLESKSVAEAVYLERAEMQQVKTFHYGENIPLLSAFSVT